MNDLFDCALSEDDVECETKALVTVTIIDEDDRAGLLAAPAPSHESIEKIGLPTPQSKRSQLKTLTVAKRRRRVRQCTRMRLTPLPSSSCSIICVFVEREKKHCGAIVESVHSVMEIIRFRRLSLALSQHKRALGHAARECRDKQERSTGCKEGRRQVQE
jgi:hypothetical protein